MQIQVIEKKEIKVVGISWNGTYSQTNEIPPLFNVFEERIGEINFRKDDSAFVTPFHSRETEFTYYVTMPVEKLEDIPKGMVGFTIPHKNYVFATHKGKAEDVEDTYKQMLLWMKEYGYEQDHHALGIEVHKRDNSNHDGNLHFDIYLPIKTYQD
nr:GyrI-like domain-containing protein [Neobacillus sp. Marseille-Q6967]